MKCRYSVGYGGFMASYQCRCGTYPGSTTIGGRTFVKSEYAKYYCLQYSEECEYAYAHGFCECGWPLPANDDYCRNTHCRYGKSR